MRRSVSGCFTVCMCLRVCVRVRSLYSMWPFSIWCGTEQGDRRRALHMLSVWAVIQRSLTHEHTHAAGWTCHCYLIFMVCRRNKTEKVTCVMSEAARSPPGCGSDCCFRLFPSPVLPRSSVLPAHLPQFSASVQPPPGDTQAFLFLISSSSKNNGAVFLEKSTRMKDN